MTVHYCASFELELGTVLSGLNTLEDEPNVFWLDIETRKVPVEGWHQKTRWEPFMVGFAGFQDPGVFFCDVVRADTEEDLIFYLNGTLDDSEVRYSATREFDEMVLRGRFINARRAHSETPGGWPNLDGLNIAWNNISKRSRVATWTRAADVESKYVPKMWAEAFNEKNPEPQQLKFHRTVTDHCVRDVLENVLRDEQVVFSKQLKRQLVEIVEGKTDWRVHGVVDLLD